MLITGAMTLLGTVRADAGALRQRRVGQWTLLAIPILALHAAYPAWFMRREVLIRSHEVRTVGTVAAIRSSSRRAYYVRAEFTVGNATHLTGWLKFGRLAPGPVGSPIQVRYFSDDPQISVIAESAP